MSDVVIDGQWSTTIRQHPERAVLDRAEEFLAQGHIAHVGFEYEGRPYVIPMLYHYSTQRPDRLYVHGGLASRMIQHLSTGIPLCAAVTMMDGLVYSRDAKYHSANYRSVMCFGRAKLLDDNAEKQAIFQEMTSRYFPGRTAGRDYAAAPKTHLDATPVLEIVIEAISAKMREGGPKGPHDSDDHAQGTCGVLPL
jgi:nitroimidazol reductase NimA-like FMN-containing flavoprotein (pyridoxamine 5'-phosphate oxidase superfamily)